MKRFKIIGMGNSRDNFTPNKDYTDPKKVLKNGKMLNGNAINCVLAIKRNAKPRGVYYTSKEVCFLEAPYARILLKWNTN